MYTHAIEIFVVDQKHVNFVFYIFFPRPRTTHAGAFYIRIIYKSSAYGVMTLESKLLFIQPVCVCVQSVKDFFLPQCNLQFLFCLNMLLNSATPKFRNSNLSWKVYKSHTKRPLRVLVAQHPRTNYIQSFFFSGLQFFFARAADLYEQNKFSCLDGEWKTQK